MILLCTNGPDAITFPSVAFDIYLFFCTLSIFGSLSLYIDEISIENLCFPGKEKHIIYYSCLWVFLREVLGPRKEKWPTLKI